MFTLKYFYIYRYIYTYWKTVNSYQNLCFQSNSTEFILVVSLFIFITSLYSWKFWLLLPSNIFDLVPSSAIASHPHTLLTQLRLWSFSIMYQVTLHCECLHCCCDKLLTWWMPAHILFRLWIQWHYYLSLRTGALLTLKNFLHLMPASLLSSSHCMDTLLILLRLWHFTLGHCSAMYILVS